MASLGKVLNRVGIQFKKITGQKEQLFAIEDGELKTANEFGNISTDRNSLKLGKTPLFLESVQIREIIYFSEGVCSLKSYRNWRNSLYKAGYAEALAHSSHQRLVTLEELEVVGQFSRGNALGASIQEKSL